MRKKLQVISICLFSLFLISCGYKKVYLKNNNIHIKNINIVGEERLAYVIKNDILMLSNNESDNRFDIEIKIEKQKKTKILNTSCKVTRYQLSFTANLKLINLENKKITQKTIAKNSDYDVDEIHSGTIKNEKSTTKNAIQQLSDEITNFIIMSIKD